MHRSTLLLAVLTSLLVAGCRTAPRGQAPAASPLAFASCMRSHGVPRFPDPPGGRPAPKPTLQQLGVSDSQFRASRAACAHLLPSGGRGPTAAALQESWSSFRAFARCMRAHGVARWPDPTRYPPHPERPTFDFQAAGIDPAAPRVKAVELTCLPMLHGVNPQRLD